MPLQSKRTVKVHDIPSDTTKEQYAEFAQQLCSLPTKEGQDSSSSGTKRFKRHFSWSKSSKSPPPNKPLSEQGQDDTSQLLGTGWLKTTFAIQSGYPIGTISFENEKSKKEALLRHAKCQDSPWKDWKVTDVFQGLTTLYECPNKEDINVDICAVHGLGGNAMHTWTADSNEMWLRDFLPNSLIFRTSRVMTFGYDSDLMDKRTNMTLENCGEALLTSLNEVRTSEKEKRRPLILVSHSFGGIVVRKALAQLPHMANCDNINLAQCGVLFLATPHSGSTQADWNAFLIALAEALVGVRSETVNKLRSFSTDSIWDKKAFLKLEPRPHYLCYAEGQKMRVKGRYQLIVPQASAALESENQAHIIAEADHSSICKFDSHLGSFVTIHSGLETVLNKLTGSNGQPTREDRRMPGHPHFVAHAYPPDGEYWWEGNQLTALQRRLTDRSTPFFGRQRDLEMLELSATSESARRKLTVVKGIGGIGKTELLMNFAATQKGRRNVFFLGAEKAQTVDSILAEIAMRIGPDMLDTRTMNRERWSHSPITERMRVFDDWLREDCNKNSLVIIDDVEAFGYPNVQAILEHSAWHLLVSTRDSNLMSIDRECREIRLSNLGGNSMTDILEHTSRTLKWPISGNLDSIVHTLYGHPLAARNAVPFIADRLLTYSNPMEEFLNLLEGPDPAGWEAFLKYSFQGRSLWDAFNTSFDRLQLLDETGDSAKLLRILPFLRIDRDCVDEMLKMDKRWLRRYTEKLPDVAILKANYPIGVGNWLSKLRSVSFYVKHDFGDTTKTIDIHPLVLKYLLLNQDESTTIRLANQILQLCYMLEEKGAHRDLQVRPHVLQCVDVCEGLGITVDDLELSENMLHWVKEFFSEVPIDERILKNAGTDENPFLDQFELGHDAIEIFIAKCRETHDALGREESSAAYNNGSMGAAECIVYYKSLRGSIDSSDYIQQSLKSELRNWVCWLQETIIPRTVNPRLISELREFRDKLAI